MDVITKPLIIKKRRFQRSAKCIDLHRYVVINLFRKGIMHKISEEAIRIAKDNNCKDVSISDIELAKINILPEDTNYTFNQDELRIMINEYLFNN